MLNLLTLFFFLSVSTAGLSQFKLLESLDKPAGMEKRKLGSEKSPDKNFTFFRSFTQNNFTYYNFYFNTKDRFDDLLKVAREKQLNKYLNDFDIVWGDEDEEYMYEQRQVLDSIIAKCKAGILLHDLRGKWVDDLLLMMGQAYYYIRRYDTAFTFFQYINNAYKDSDDYDDKTIYVDEQTSTYSLSTPEKKSSAHPPARNDALLWIARTLSAMNQTASAFSIINILSNDVYFPKRLEKQLLKVKAYAHYQKGDYAEAAATLEKCYEDLISKRRANDIVTARMLLIAHLYNKGYRYHDAYRMYQKIAKQANDCFVSMNAKIQSLGLDYIERLSSQVSEIISEKKYKRYAPMLYFGLSKKLFDLGDRTESLRTAKKAFYDYQGKMTSIQLRTLRLILASNYLYFESYGLAGQVMTSDIINSLNTSERIKYEINNPRVLEQLVVQKQKINDIDSLFKLANLPKDKLSSTIKQIKRKHLQSKKNSKSKKTSNQEQSWYFTNDYLRLEGKQGFDALFGGEIKNIDMWRNLPALEFDNYAAKNISQDSLNIDDKILTFINQIPITSEAKQAMNDKLFYALTDYAFLLLNNFTNPKQSRPYFQRAQSLRISEEVKQSPVMQQLMKVMQFDNNNDKAETQQAINKKGKISTSSLVYRRALNDFMEGKLDNFLMDDYYVLTSLSRIERQQFNFMKASALCKRQQQEKGKALLTKLYADASTDSSIKQKVADLLAYLE